MKDDVTWMGRPIDEMPTGELAAALKAAVRLLRSTSPGTFIHPDVDARVTPAGTIVARTFKWAFIPARHLWSEEDRQELQARLDAFAPRHGLQGAIVRFGPDQLEVEVPRPLRIEQLVALQEWLNAEKDALDVSQVP
jgi:hypothetical protein